MLLTPVLYAQPHYDICIYGGTSAGVVAAYVAKKAGKSVIIIESGKHLGGLSSGGLGYTDIGNKYVVTGIAKDFYRRVGNHYGKFEQWIFEPHVAEDIFKAYIAGAKIDVYYQYRLLSVNKTGNEIKSIVVEPSIAGQDLSDKVISASQFIDCSYEGDLMAKAGVSYSVGREANSMYKETYNGVQLLKGHQFPDFIDPYRIKAEPASGLIWGISPGKLASQGSGDDKVQAYNYRICLTNNAANLIPVKKPEGYDSTHYELLARLIEAQPGKRTLNDYFIWSLMPNQKTDINNRNGFSTDMIGNNYTYPEGSYLLRAKYIADLTEYTKGLLYFFGHDSRVPIALRTQMLQWGYPKDEFLDNDHWSHQPYIREARRMLGKYVMTQANCIGKEKAQDGIAMAAYTMDSHNCDRLVVNGMVKNEGNVEVGDFPPYPIAYRALVPKDNECKNLIVPVCLSASHIAYGSIRMEPVFMVLGQVAATAASIAIDEKIAVQKVSYLKINNKIKNDPLLDGREPEQIVDNQSKNVVINGNWKTKVGEAYGPDMLYLDSHGKSDETIRFYPQKIRRGKYQLYCYYPALSLAADTIAIKIFDGRALHREVLLKSKIRIEGQTTGEWVPIGTYLFSGKLNPYVEIDNTGSAGLIPADAVLFKPYKNEEL